jgi:VWFA-related protein
MRIPIILAGIVAASAIAGAQQRPVFRTETNYVEIDVVATDKNGQFVPGLAAGDFQVRESKTPQKVDSFTYVDLPVGSNAPAAPIEPARVNPELRLAAGPLDGRLYLIFLDPQAENSPGAARSVTAGTSNFGLLDVRARAREFVLQYLQPGDLAAVWNTELRGADLTFTTDKTDLLRAIDGKKGLNGSAAGTTQMVQLREAVELLGGIQGRRKSLLLFTEGWPSIVTAYRNPKTGAVKPVVTSWFAGLAPGRPSVPGTMNNLNMPQEFVGVSQLDITGRADVHIYTIDTRGLVAPTGNLAGSSRSAYSSGSGAEDTAALVSGEYDALSLSTMDLTTIADHTGGLAFINSNDFKKGFTQIVDDNSRYYILGYYSPKTKRDGSFVPVQVTCLKPGLTIRARKGYIAR